MLRIFTLQGGTNNLTRNKVEDMLYTPDLDGSLMSVKKLSIFGFNIHFEDNRCRNLKEDKVLGIAEADSHLYCLDCKEVVKVPQKQKHNECIHTWHRRLGHRSPGVSCKHFGKRNNTSRRWRT